MAEENATASHCDCEPESDLESEDFRSGKEMESNSGHNRCRMGMTTITLLGKDADGLFGPYGLSAPWIDGLAHNNGEHGRHERAHPIGFVGRLGISIPGYPATQCCAQLILENLCGF